MGYPQLEADIPGSHAIVHGGPTLRFYSTTQDVMDRVLAVNLVAQLSIDHISSEVALQRMRRALLDGKWADALVEWMSQTGRSVDVYDQPPEVYDSTAKVWTEADVPATELKSMFSNTPLFASESSKG